MSDTLNIAAEFLLLTLKISWAFVVSGWRWFMQPREKSVVGQVCVVTGAGGGLGRLFAVEFARRGAVLVLWDIDRHKLEETADIVCCVWGETTRSRAAEDTAETEEPQVHTYVCDVSQRESVYATAERVWREVGRIDMLVNSAGVVSGHHLLECPDELIERTMMVNCHAHFWTTKAFLPKMLEVNHGHIVTVASSLGLFSTAGIEDYCASKFGAIGFHESLSHELKAAEKDGIKMTLVCPFLVDTDMFQGCQIRKCLKVTYQLAYCPSHADAECFLVPCCTQEGNGSLAATPGTRVLCETGHEGHPERTAHDLHTSHHVHCDLL